MRTRPRAGCRCRRRSRRSPRAHELDHLRVQLDRIDLRRAVQERQQHLLAAAGTEDQHLRGRRRRRYGSAGGGVVEIGERRRVAVEGVIALSASPSVKTPSCAGGSRLLSEQARRVAERDGRALDDVSRPSGLERSSTTRAFGTCSAMRQALVLRHVRPERGPARRQPERHQHRGRGARACRRRGAPAPAAQSAERSRREAQRGDAGAASPRGKAGTAAPTTPSAPIPRRRGRRRRRARSLREAGEGKADHARPEKERQDRSSVAEPEPERAAAGPRRSRAR